MELWIWRSTQMPKIPNNKVPMDTVEVPMMKSATDPTVVMRKLPVVLPHRLIPHLLKHNLVVPDFAAIREYWIHMFTHAEWGPGHPLAEQGGNCKHLPVYLYADDVKWTNEEKRTQVSLGLVLDERTHSMTTHFPLWILREISSLAVFVDRVFDHSGLYEACRLVVDSLNILFRGEVCEPDMEPPLAALTELRADWKFYKETWRV
ncbi:Kcnh2 [Symbiodinium sp. CCMP2592]|nr:Kcnh2 [Symbiodinium sp. CCMP2592]